jgi:hypothetical protein
VRRVAGTAALLLMLAVLGVDTRAASPPSSATPVSSTSTTSSAAVAPAALPRVTGAELPDAESPAPNAAEWNRGKRVAPTRGHAARCELTLVREWLRVRCPGLVGAGLVAGSPRGVSVRVLGRLFIDGNRGDVAAVVVLPIRRGEARIVTFNDTSFEYDSAALAEGGVLSVQFRAGRADPVLVMSDFPKDPPTPGFLGPE